MISRPGPRRRLSHRRHRRGWHRHWAAWATAGLWTQLLRCVCHRSSWKQYRSLLPPAGVAATDVVQGSLKYDYLHRLGSTLTYSRGKSEHFPDLGIDLR
jgi:hypothetical protein